MANALKKIQTRTKRLQALHPGKAYRTLHKQATREYNSGTIPKARKKVSGARKRAKKSKSVVRVRPGVVKAFKRSQSSYGIVTVPQLKAVIRRKLEERLGKLLIAHYNEDTVAGTKKLDKQIREVKAQLKAFG